MTKHFCLLSIVLSNVSLLHSAPSLSAQEQQERLEMPPAGFSQLFNGRDLSDWCGREQVDPAVFRSLDDAERAERKQVADADFKKHWRVSDGEIVNDGEGVFCTTVEEFGDFELLLEWKMISRGTDSGIYLRGCPQVQIWDPSNEELHKHGGHLGSGGLWNNNPGSPGKDPLLLADRPIGEWNTFRILLRGDRATVHLNGKLVVDNAVMHNYWNREEKLYSRGPIQLQTHGGEMRFRNLFIRSLDEPAAGKADSSPETLSDYRRIIPGSDVSFDMAAIPAGEFLMGSPPEEVGHQDNEGPQIAVSIPAFWMGKHEVTWAEYKLFMNLCSVFEQFDDRDIRQVTKDNEIDAISAPSKLYDPSFTFQSGEEPDQPAVSMSQFAAKQYTKWLSLLTGEFYRLPTESEWEYACRAGTTTAYCYGDDPDELPDYAWTEDNADYETHIVGQKLPNAWGLYDMHGNAAEWVLDEYRPDWYATLPKRLCTIKETICWPTKLYPRGLRGGSILVSTAECRSASRRASDDEELRSYDPNTPKSPWWFASDDALDIGFRIVRPLEKISREEQEKYWQADIRSITRDVNRRIDQEGRGERGLVDPQLPQATLGLRQKHTEQERSP